ncbi:MAG TPA: primosomal protein N' [Candidatus Aminicenantes bacterium]|nr:primosomal protein N' [Acidobacteriota bacterium]HOY99185.1 primosomal protein N' [Candidatus Aminicenantes bacterium]
MTLFVDVAFPRPLLRSYTYAIPAALSGRVRPGVRVRASLGRQTAVGVAVRVHDEPPAGEAAVKEIAAVLDEAPALPLPILAFTRKLAAEQAAGWGALLGLALPPDPAPPLKRRAAEKGRVEVEQLELDLESTAAVAAAAAEIGRRIGAGERAEFLAWGGRGAGRAMIIEGVRRALDHSRNVLVLLPDIARAGDLRSRFQAALGTAPALLHGQMTPRAQRAEWERVERGDARVILGSRAALFKPWPRIGLIVVEDESDESHGQAGFPSYDVRSGARLRSTEENAVLLLVAEAPTVGAYARARAAGALFSLGGEEPPPGVRVVDDSTGKDVLTEAMREGILGCLAAGGRAVLFLNRRGYASLLFCPRCGFIPRCGRCGSIQPYHKKADRLVCRSCGAEDKRPSSCPSCRHRVLEPRGGGVEALEEELGGVFPGARIAVFDRDRARRAAERKKILDAYGRGRLDLLVATQLLVRQPGLPPADFVGVFNPESGLAFPDFLAPERTFQSLLRMIRFARTGVRPGRVVIQTGFPGHYGIRTASRADFEAFFSEEIELRRLFRRPPFTASADVVLSGRDARLLGRQSRALAAVWREADPKVEVLGPSFATEPGRPGIKKIQLELRSDSAEAITALLAAGLEDFGRDVQVVRHDGFIR